MPRPFAICRSGHRGTGGRRPHSSNRSRAGEECGDTGCGTFSLRGRQALVRRVLMAQDGESTALPASVIRRVSRNSSTKALVRSTHPRRSIARMVCTSDQTSLSGWPGAWLGEPRASRGMSPEIQKPPGMRRTVPSAATIRRRVIIWVGEGFGVAMLQDGEGSTCGRRQSSRLSSPFCLSGGDSLRFDAPASCLLLGRRSRIGAAARSRWEGIAAGGSKTCHDGNRHDSWAALGVKAHRARTPSVGRAVMGATAAEVALACSARAMATACATWLRASG